MSATGLRTTKTRPSDPAETSILFNLSIPTNITLRECPPKNLHQPRSREYRFRIIPLCMLNTSTPPLSLPTTPKFPQYETDTLVTALLSPVWKICLPTAFPFQLQVRAPLSPRLAVIIESHSFSRVILLSTAIMSPTFPPEKPCPAACFWYPSINAV
jgi:hypothetical protein